MPAPAGRPSASLVRGRALPHLGLDLRERPQRQHVHGGARGDVCDVSGDDRQAVRGRQPRDQVGPGPTDWLGGILPACVPVQPDPVVLLPIPGEDQPASTTAGTVTGA